MQTAAPSPTTNGPHHTCDSSRPVCDCGRCWEYQTNGPGEPPRYTSAAAVARYEALYAPGRAARRPSRGAARGSPLMTVRTPREAFQAGAAFMRQRARLARHDAQYDRAPAQIEWPNGAALEAAFDELVQADRGEDAADEQARETGS